MRPTISTLLFLSAFSTSAQELPIVVDDLFSGEKKLQIHASASYATRSVREVYPYSFQNEDVVDGRIGIRYGVAPDVDLSATVSGYYLDSRQSFGDDHTHSRDGVDGNTLQVRASKRWQPESKPQNWIFSGGASVLEDSITYGGSVATYWQVDPLLLSAAFHVSYRDPDSSQLTSGYSMQFAPQFTFVLNHKVSLAGGVAWSWAEARADNDIRQSSSALLFGMDYGLTANSSLHISGNLPTSESGFSATLGYVHRH